LKPSSSLREDLKLRERGKESKPSRASISGGSAQQCRDGTK
jgi:hypothetical protein